MVRTRNQVLRGVPESPDRIAPQPGQILTENDQGNEIGNGAQNIIMATQQVEEGHRTEATQRSPSQTGATTSGERTNLQKQPWSYEEKKELMWCHIYCKLSNKNWKDMYKLWRERNPSARPYLDANKLQNQRRHIEQNKRIPEKEIQIITDEVKTLFENVQHMKTQEQVDEIETEELPRHAIINQNLTEDNLLKDKIQNKIQEFLKLPLSERPRLPKIKNTPNSKTYITKGNYILEEILKAEKDEDLLHINTAVYGTAYILTELINQKPIAIAKNDTNINKKVEIKRKWEQRIERKISILRADLSRLTEMKNGKIIRSLRSYRHLKKTYLKDPNKPIEETIEIVKQKITATAQRLRRYKVRQQQFYENRNFLENGKSFYRNIRNDKNCIQAGPRVDQIEQFWKKLYEDETTHNQNALWTNQYDKRRENNMEWNIISEEEIRQVILKTHNWKATGVDKIPNFWLKRITTAHKHLAKEYNEIIEKPQTTPEWLTMGLTYLLPKDGDSKSPKNYRPITCLNTMYKILTAIMANRISKYLEDNHLMPTEQKGCMKGYQGCRDHLLYAKAMVEDCKKYKKNLNIAWIDYQKAYDSVPHSWVLESMGQVGLPNKLILAIKYLMCLWNTTMQLKTTQGMIQTNRINIRRGLYQGDSLSPVLFCLALAPLSTLIRNVATGYKITGASIAITHQLYMDDLKITSKSETELNKILGVVKEFTNDIKMKFGIDKCATATFRRGKLVCSENIKLNESETIKSLEPGKTYKYLGIQEGDGIDHQQMKDKITREYLTRIRKIMNTHLNCKNKFQAIGTLAVPVIRYGFGIINWTLEEIKKLDRKTRKILTMHGQLHPREDIDRLYVSRKLGGRGLQQLESAFYSTIFNTNYYIKQKSMHDPTLQCFKEYDVNLPPKKSLKGKAKDIERKIFTPIKRFENINENQRENEGMNFGENTTQRTPKQFKEQKNQRLYETWRNKPMHGQKVRDMEKVQFDPAQSFKWLTDGRTKGETESLIVAAQDQAIKTRYLASKIHGTGNNPKCRICKKADETISHIISRCPELLKSEYVLRHNKICEQIHFELCKHFDCPITSENWYNHKPAKVVSNGITKTTILYDMPIQTDRTIMANRPDIVVRAGTKTYLIEISVPADENIVTRDANKQLKYKDLSIEIGRMWKTKTEVIPIIIGATGFVDKEYRSNVLRIPGNHNPTDLQRTAIYGTAHIIRKVLT